MQKSKRIDPIDFRDLHKGQRGFLLATGPSVHGQDLSWLSDEVVVGVNYAHRYTLSKGWVPTYMATADTTRLRDMSEEYAALGDRTSVVLTNRLTAKNIYTAPNLVMPNGVHVTHAHDEYCWDCAHGVRVSQPGSSTGLIALPLLLWLGCNPIYLLGCDCTIKGHSYKDDKSPLNRHAKHTYEKYFFPSMGVAHREAAKKGIQIFNATMGGNLEVLPRVSLDSVRRNEA
jgi:hypothetical protein